MPVDPPGKGHFTAFLTFLTLGKQLLLSGTSRHDVSSSCTLPRQCTWVPTCLGSQELLQFSCADLANTNPASASSLPAAIELTTPRDPRPCHQFSLRQSTSPLIHYADASWLIPAFTVALSASTAGFKQGSLGDERGRLVLLTRGERRHPIMQIAGQDHCATLPRHPNEADGLLHSMSRFMHLRLRGRQPCLLPAASRSVLGPLHPPHSLSRY